MGVALQGLSRRLSQHVLFLCAVTTNWRVDRQSP